VTEQALAVGSSAALDKVVKAFADARKVGCCDAAHGLDRTFANIFIFGLGGRLGGRRCLPPYSVAMNILIVALVAISVLNSSWGVRYARPQRARLARES
jgi:hypothetical protein